MLTSNIEIIQHLMNFLFILAFSVLGAYIKDTYNTFTNKEEEIKVTRIIVSSIVSTVILFSLSDYILTKITYKLFILPCFIGGVIGFELFGKINNVNFWLDIIFNNLPKK